MKAAVALIAPLALASPALAAPEPDFEARNYLKQLERPQYQQLDPRFHATVAYQSLAGASDAVRTVVRDPDRKPINLCGAAGGACGWDTRYTDWDGQVGVRVPVGWVNRNGATISGHLWAPFPTKDAPVPLPGVVIVTGDTQTPETIYWWAAEQLAEAGYQVLTWDPQGHGMSDTIGDGEDALRDVVTQQSSDFGDQQALDEEFAEETTDALDFFLSTPDDAYVPRRESAKPKQDAKAAAGLVNAFNPLHAVLDAHRIGLVGHSRGAFAVSILGSRDERVDAIVGWDNLTAGGPTKISPTDTLPPLAPRVPALGISSDYYVGDPPYASPPDPQLLSAAFHTHADAGIDAAEITIRGGTHFEYSYVANAAFTATLRGIDLVAWYTLAWFDKELKGIASADDRLLTDRWRHDARGAEVDLAHDGDLYSAYYRSQLAIHVDGRLVRCDDLRAGCAELHASA
jgi:pimeloyl-ACP methyl ester carboxylesterase